MNDVQHSQPFIVTYSNDWSTYYSGKNIPALKRQSYEFNQTLALPVKLRMVFLMLQGVTLILIHFPNLTPIR